MLFHTRIMLRSTLGLALACSALAFSGCAKISGSSTTAAISESTAREALTAALDAWKGGQKPGQVASQKPSLQVVDSKWSAGQKLDSYEVVSTETLDDGTVRFTLKLNLKSPGKPHEEKYTVYGKDPVWIFADADFSRSLNMDNNPSLAASRGKR